MDTLFAESLDIDPSSEDLRQQLRVIPACRGVLLLADARSRPIQLLTAADLRRMAVARLAVPDTSKPRKADLQRITRKVFWIPCIGSFRCDLRHLETARHLWPQRYRQHLTLPRCHFVGIDLDHSWPHFAIQGRALARQPDQYVFGLFPNRKAAERFIEILVTAFRLCRRPELPGSRDRVRSCPYLQMESCPAPCIGRISPETYRESILQAIQVASGNYRHVREEWLDQMHELSDRRQFEQAHELKQAADALADLGTTPYAWTSDLRRLRILHIEPAGRIRTAGQRRMTQTFAVFLIQDGRVVESPDLPRCQVPAFEEYMDSTKAISAPLAPTAEQENLALVSYHLFRSQPKGIWLNITDGMPRPEQLTALLETHFGPEPMAGNIQRK